ncbi:MAG TPA: amidohydrolase family protein [Actinomycetota bacterium]|jgi:predicted TIM-barrel fold metal-dependent hydrolase|nr:amidohydrolase family protein [Actinomycetota bacterium]
MRDLPLRAYRPRQMARREPTQLAARPPYPLIDAHNHLGRWLTGTWSIADAGALVALMDELGIDTIVNLDGMWGAELDANLDRYDRAYPGRFATFAQWDRAPFARDGWAELGAQIADAFDRGASGLKVWKDLGLHLRDANGQLVMPDDTRLDPVWDAVAAAGRPVTIHVGDPAAFFEPLDERNERLEELLENPDWWFGDRERFPSFDRILDALESLIARRSDVTWIGAHALCAAEDLVWVERMLATYANAYADVAARIAELGRFPHATRDLIERYPDRFVFGTDAFPPDRAVYAVHRRFFETADESFPYDADPEEPPSQGRWTISGLSLSDDALAALYAGTARRLLFG